MSAMLCVVVMSVFLLATEGLVLRSLSSRRSSSSLSMAAISPSSMFISGLIDRLGIIPICVEGGNKFMTGPQAIKGTTIDDPTAGMSTEEVTNYISNVGGGMCGYPEWVRTAVGLGLNFSLIGFGLLTVGYVVLGGLNFALEKQVEDSIKSIDDPAYRKKGEPSLEFLAEQAGMERLQGQGMGLQSAMVNFQGGEEAVRAKQNQERLMNGDMSAVLEAQKGSGFEGKSTRGQNRLGRRLLNNSRPDKRS